MIREYAMLAFLDPADFYDAEGNLLPVNQMPAHARRALTGQDVEELFERDGNERVHVGRLRKVRFTGKLGALDSLARHLKMFVDRAEITIGPNGRPLIPITLAREILDAEDIEDVGDVKDE